MQVIGPLPRQKVGYGTIEYPSKFSKIKILGSASDKMGTLWNNL